MSNTQNEKIWAVSMAPGSRQSPVHVLRRLVGSEGWIVQQMKEVGDPTKDPVPYSKGVGRATKEESVTIARLRKEKEEAERQRVELQAKFDELAAQIKKEPETQTA